MPLDKRNMNLSFGQGLDTQTDPFQVQPGRMLALRNTVFDKGGLLQKRNGYAPLTSLPNNTNTYLTTHNGGLTAIGTSLSAFSDGSDTWVNRGYIQPCDVSVLPIVRAGTTQTQSDSATAANGLTCTVYTDNVVSGGSTVASYKYTVTDSNTGQCIIPPAVISANATTAPRVYVLGNYFFIVFGAVIGGVSRIQYFTVSTADPTVTSGPTDISTTVSLNAALNFDCVVANNNIYIAYNGSDVGGAIRLVYITRTLTQSNTLVFAGRSATTMSMAADTSGANAVIYAAFYNTSGTVGYILAVNQQLNIVLSPTQIINTGTVNNITCAANNGAANVFWQVQNAYSFDGTIRSDFIRTVRVTQGGSVGATSVMLRGVGLASKAFYIGSTIYMLTTYGGVLQPTYFLVDSTGRAVAKIAYSNGAGYKTTGLPNANVSGTTVKISYLFKDLIQAVNKTQGVASSAGVYAQTGVNDATFDITTDVLNSAEIGGSLHINGGFLWMYDGVKPVEHSFHLYPESIKLVGSATGGTMTAQQYFYAVTYEWTDAAGNIQRSAPSVPISVTTTGATSSVTVSIPTYRITYKSGVKIVIYRWSTAQQIYYQVTSVTVPTLNDTTVDSVNFVDTQPDSAIIGNNILYTTGGVVENIGAPCTSVMSLFKSRLFLVDAEDRNLLWYSKQVIAGTPVEMSDLFTIYVAPTTSAKGATGPITALAALDDKLIIFKQEAIYYITGNGPDNTGSFNDLSEPVFITSTVGCANQNSIVFMPQGLMFQSDKGIWLLGRDLNTSYIGAPVDGLTAPNEDGVLPLVQSAVNVPGTNQVRFTLDTGITLMYDFYFSQWGTFSGVPAISSTLYEGLHTYINSFGQAFQESEGTYLDGSTPVLVSFTTAWMNLAGLQGYERAYSLFILGSYLSPHKLVVQVAYDYNPSPTQSTTITPDNYSPAYGGDTLWGGSELYGGQGNLEQWQVYFQRQKCQAFQISVQEVYDASFGVAAGAGLTLSGINLEVGVKQGSPKLKPSRSIG